MSGHNLITSIEGQYLLEASAETERKWIAFHRDRELQRQQSEAASRDAAADLLAEQRQAEQRTEAELRQALAAAISDYDDAWHQVGTAQGNIDRAKYRCDAADADLAENYADLDDRIVAHHIAQIKAGTEHPLPAALQAAEQQRGQLVDRISANHRVHTQLQAELRDAEAALADCATRRSAAACRVISRSYDKVATELNAAMDNLISARTALITVSATWINGPAETAPLRLSDFARTAIFCPIPSDIQPDLALVDTVRAWYAELLNDADATPDQAHEPDA